MNWLDIIFIISVAVLGYTALSMEYYARKSGVAAAPSVPWMRNAVVKTLGRHLDDIKDKSESPVIYELGSGWGTLALAAAKAYPHTHIVGYEISTMPLLVSKFRAFIRRQKNVSFYKDDFFEKDFSEVDGFLTYLIGPLMPRLGDKLKAEAKKEAFVICNTFPIPDWTPEQVETIQDFVYELNIYSFKLSDQKLPNQ